MAKRNIYGEVTDRIIEALEKGVGPWTRPWYSRTEHRNAFTGRPYRGVNILLLNIASAERGFSLPLWLTYREAKRLGGHVRRGEQGTTVVFWKILEVPEVDPEGLPVFDADSGEQRMVQIPLIRYYTVFNVEQCEGLRLRIEPAEPKEEERQAYDLAERILELPKIEWGEKACYIPEKDVVVLPPRSRFASPEAFYGVALHEVVHWTGHPTRLCRAFGTRFGDLAYAFEELVAEMGSAFLGAHVGIPFDQVQHPEYIDGWLKVLRGDQKAIFAAAREAQKACDWLLEQAGVTSEAGKTENTEEVAA